MEKKTLVLTMIILNLAYGCLTSQEKEIAIVPAIDKDTAFIKTYHQSTREYEVIHNFETKFTVKATILDHHIRRAISDRYQRIFNDPEPILREVSNKTGFFIVLYTADSEMHDLANKNLWNVQLQQKGSLISPILVKHLTNKQRWKPFFKHISPWSHEFLVLFETQNQNSTENQSDPGMKLILSNPDGRVTAEWSATEISSTNP